ncbi:lipase family protein [Paenibacillus agri]|uniref:Lipase family protein n=1 Tax=Paenibacillus agri TaxID=2744309 RepID=A0A850EVZ2_9BACL|nr:lipase family protein [Paenibacillus agri]NUU62041.1 lipase family protein [Paenibacillus agri]
MGYINIQEQWAIFLATICEQAYAQYTNPDGSFVVPLNYTVVDTIQAKSISNAWERFGFILESAQEIIVAFRGTISTTNWISNAMAMQIKPDFIKEDCLTHRGFTNIYSSAREGILSTLGRLSPEKILYITGHSLGGALATLCAIDVAANTNHTSPNLFTYGSPRVGDPEFVKAFTKYVRKSSRIANIFDLVTYVPPPVLKLPKQDIKYYYQHVQTLYSLSFQKGSVGENHIISSYFAELSKLQPQFAEELCLTNPGFCPVTEVKTAQPVK